MKRINRLAAGLICALMAAALVAPAAAHGCHGGRGHHGGAVRSVQTTVTVCPYEDCALAGRHTHSRVIYCGYSHDGGFCDGSCAASGCHGSC